MSTKSFTTINKDTKDLPIFIEEWEEKAKEKMEKGPFDYIRSGAGDEETLRLNRSVFQKWSILPRVLRDVSLSSTKVTLYGNQLSFPLLLSPVGYQGLADKDGEKAAARAAAKAGIPYIASTVSTYSLEEIASAAPEGNNWFQLYWSQNREVSASMVKRAEKAGFRAIVVTVDTGVLGWRKSDYKNGFVPLMECLGDANYRNDPAFQKSVQEWNDENIVAAIMNNILHPDLNWEDVLFLREHTTLPIILKGILHPKDAKKAVDLGFDGIIISNHGGRQLDGAISSLDALQLVASVVNKQIPLIMDGGIRSGADMYKAIALGADAVAIGRPFIYGLAVSGELGVSSIINNLQKEFELTLALSGEVSVQDITVDHLFRQD
ncbi:alpha-hydroxy acid oxidase [Niallia sp. NCCP-28]|uniref:alpha-hydroxy acid oxidase n=1 Tax=Niallia sp. NCCP-28 TaxID=2934712 RepID=UPI00207EBB82|nr:alpha-hydroxy acid oxidase [Niallia sp. NCCP-28]GKU84534.1 oxidoreductase [Niallia sp. NCCP-28]